MSELTVDREKCNICGICVKECPLYIIKMQDAESLPAWSDDGESLCVKCGHCVISCPTTAISVNSITPDACIEVKRDLLPSAEQVELFLKSRRSVRAYKDKKVPRELLSKLIDIARYAPSGHNTQPVHWLVIENPNEVRRLAGIVADWMRMVIEDNPAMAQALHLDRIIIDWDRGNERIMRGAPHAIVAYGRKDNFMAPQAATIALTTLELAAYGYGLGACWAGYFHAAASGFPPMVEALGLPEGYNCLGAMMVGYPQHRFYRIPTRNQPHILWR